MAAKAFEHVRMLLIDNYDSFTYNLVQAFAAQGADVMVYRNDMISTAEGLALNPTHLVISPGPGRPEDAGVSMEMIAAFAGKVPILGVCLGHQSIGQVYGGDIVHAREIMHGKTSQVVHLGTGVFKGLVSPFVATRYHSLVIDKESVPDCLEVTAWTELADGRVDEIMGVRHKELAIEGVQFHPESILTDAGKQLLGNFLRIG